MYGVDWKVIKEKYVVLLFYVKICLDLNYIIGEMIGELNCGYVYVNLGEMEQFKWINIGLFGVEIICDKSGFFCLEKIFFGVFWSKELCFLFMELGVDVKVGEYIVVIDGVLINIVKDMYFLLVGKVEIFIEILLNVKFQFFGVCKVVISLFVNEYFLIYYNWVQDNIKKVDQVFNGCIGYIYILDMGLEGLNEFVCYFYL